MKINLVAGLILGIFSTGTVLVMHQLGSLRSPEAANWALVAGMACHSLVLIVALIRHRAAAQPEEVPYARLFGAGLFISFLGGVVSAIGSYFFTTQVDPGHLAWVREKTAEQLREAGLQGPELEEQLRLLPELITPGTYALQALRALLVVGFLLTLVISAFVRLRGLRQTQTPSP